MSATNVPLTTVVFAILLGLIVGVTVWAARRTRTRGDYWAAGRSITSRQNGLALAGDFMSAGTFLGATGLLFFFGFDGTLILVAGAFSFLPVLFLFADRLRNAGAYTIADVLCLRFNRRPVRAASAAGGLVVTSFYMVAQLVGAGAVLQALTGMPFTWAVILTGGFMTAYVTFGGMLGATWVQIVKAALLFVAGLSMAVAVLGRTGWDLGSIFIDAVGKNPAGESILGPGLFLPSANKLNVLSYGLSIMLGTAGLPHIMSKFFTVRDGQTARRSLAWGIGIMSTFYILLILIGFGARGLMSGADATAAAQGGGNLVTPVFSAFLGGGSGTIGGDLTLAVVSGVTFATILAVVSGLLISASSAVAHDLWTGVVKRDSSEVARQEPRVARATTTVLGVIAVLITLWIGSGVNVTILITLAFTVAASANFPVLTLALFWKNFTTSGAVSGIAVGLVGSVGLILMSTTVQGGDAWIKLGYPGLLSIPIGFLACWIGTRLGHNEDTERRFRQMQVRTETGLEPELESRAV